MRTTCSAPKYAFADATGTVTVRSVTSVRRAAGSANHADGVPSSAASTGTPSRAAARTSSCSSATTTRPGTSSDSGTTTSSGAPPCSATSDSWSCSRTARSSRLFAAASAVTSFAFSMAIAANEPSEVSSDDSAAVNRRTARCDTISTPATLPRNRNGTPRIVRRPSSSATRSTSPRCVNPLSPR